jgi:hypothetical protein
MDGPNLVWIVVPVVIPLILPGHMRTVKARSPLLGK